MKNEFRTSDLALTAYLKLNGLELEDVASIGRQKAVFVFKDTDHRQRLIMDFFNREAKVDPLEYLHVMKSLKAAAVEANSNDMKEARNEIQPT